MAKFCSIEEAIADIKAGKMIIVVDDEDRENEGDFIMAADGSVVHGLALIYILRDISDIAKFKIIQHQKDLVEVQLVTHSKLAQQTIDAVKQSFSQRLGQEMIIDLSFHNEIAAEANGKFRYVVNHVSQATSTKS